MNRTHTFDHKGTHDLKAAAASAAGVGMPQLKARRFCVRCVSNQPQAGGRFHAGMFTCLLCLKP